MSVVNSAYYGIAGEPVQPTGEASAQPTPELSTTIATAPPAGRLGIFHQAGFWIVALLALAIGLVHVSIRFA